MWSGALRHGENESGCDLSTQRAPEKHYMSRLNTDLL